MAQSTCGHCGNKTWEIKMIEPSGSRYKLYFVQCAKCGVPVSVQEYYNINARLETLAKKLNINLDS